MITDVHKLNLNKKFWALQKVLGPTKSFGPYKKFALQKVLGPTKSFGTSERMAKRGPEVLELKVKFDIERDEVISRGIPSFFLAAFVGRMIK